MEEPAKTADQAPQTKVIDQVTPVANPEQPPMQQLSNPEDQQQTNAANQNKTSSSNTAAILGVVAIIILISIALYAYHKSG